MICVYNMASGELIEISCTENRPEPALKDGSSDMPRPVLQLQEIPLVKEKESFGLTPDLVTGSIDSFFD